MFSPQKFARFIVRAVAAILPPLGLAFVLGLVTELSQQQVQLPAVWRSWRFWLSVARDVVPAAVALVGVHMLAARFIRGLYKAESLGEARGFLNRGLFGQKSFGPWLRIADDRPSGGPEHVLQRMGGPGSLVVYTDSAVVTERGGRFAHVARKGFPRLEPFEKIYHVVDLRPKRWPYEVKAMSKEGIPITCEADISYQIDYGDAEPTKEDPYPASDEVILRAATCTWIREADRPEETRTMDWGGRVIISFTEGALRSIVSQYPLDQLVGLAFDGSNPREEIRKELEKRLRGQVSKLGARILRVDLGDCKVANEVAQQWIEAWRSNWESWSTRRRAMGRAKQIEQMEATKTQAQMLMLQAIINAFEPMQAEGEAASVQVVLDRMFMVMSRAAADPLTRVYLPQEAVSTLKLLQEICGSGPRALPAPGP